MDDDKLREEFPGNTYSGIEPNKTDMPETTDSISNPPVEKTDKKKDKSVKPKRLTIGERIVQSIKSIDPIELFDNIIDNWLFPGLQAAGEEILRIIFNPNNRPRAGSSRGAVDGSGRKLKYHSSITDGAIRYGNIGSRIRPEILMPDQSMAKDVYQAVVERIEDYDKITLKDFYEIVDDVSKGEISIRGDFATLRYGWYDIGEASITHTRDGWLLSMPKAVDLK